jgi:hypothetical protein
MTALIREEQPSQFAVDDFFFHAHQFVSVKGEIGGILVRSSIDGFFSRQVVPLLAGDLAASAGRTQGCIN